MPYYAVIRGRNPGVYSDYHDCMRVVEGFSNNYFRKFNSQGEARRFFRDNREGENREYDSQEKSPDYESPNYSNTLGFDCDLLEYEYVDDDFEDFGIFDPRSVYSF